MSVCPSKYFHLVNVLDFGKSQYSATKFMNAYFDLQL